MTHPECRRQHPEVGALDTFCRGFRRYLTVATVTLLVKSLLFDMDPST